MTMQKTDLYYSSFDSSEAQLNYAVLGQIKMFTAYHNRHEMLIYICLFTMHHYRIKLMLNNTDVQAITYFFPPKGILHSFKVEIKILKLSIGIQSFLFQ